MSAILDLRLGDCLEGMKEFPDGHFDLAVVDPQTGQGEGKKHASRPSSVKQKNGSRISITKPHAVKEWDSAPPNQEYYNELIRVSKHQIIMCENYLYFEQKKTSAGRIVWNLLRQNDFSDCQIMWASFTNKIHYFEYLWNGMCQGAAINSRQQKGNKSLNQKRIHPSEKPIKVYKYLLQNFAAPGWKILDTHLGSMSSAIACWDMGFDLTGFEIDEDYYKAGIERVERHKRQGNLFDPRPEVAEAIQLKIT